MNNRHRIHLAIRNSPSRPIVLTTLFAVAIAISSPFWPAKAKVQSGTTLPKLVSLDKVTSGMLLLCTKKPGRYLPAPMLMTKVDMQINVFWNMLPR